MYGRLTPFLSPQLFVLSPASLAHSALFSGYYTYLASNVSYFRVQTGIMLGDGSSGSVRSSQHKAGNDESADEASLKRAVRAHANFSETTPFAFFLIFLAELNGAPTSLVHGAFTSLFLARVAHANLGLKADDIVGAGRLPGHLLTYGITVAAGLYNVGSISTYSSNRSDRLHPLSYS
jgi:uncharacterized membrane protein YecN with MAPEG domain